MRGNRLKLIKTNLINFFCLNIASKYSPTNKYTKLKIRNATLWETPELKPMIELK